MRKVFLFYLLSIACYGQSQKIAQLDSPPTLSQLYARGTWLIGMQAGYSKAFQVDHNLTIQAYSGYFIANKLLLGLAVTVNQEKYRIVRDITNTIGPVVRYQITRTRISPFLTTSYQFGQRTISGTVSQMTIQTVSDNGIRITSISGSRIGGSGVPERVFLRSLGAGISIGITPPLRIDLLLNWQDKVGKTDASFHFDQGVYQGQIGLNYLF